jgi:hypothetical protein
MASNQSNWLWDANVFGEQAPAHNPAPTPGVYPQCGRQQERNWALENLLYGMENVIAPGVETISTNSSLIYDTLVSFVLALDNIQSFTLNTAKYTKQATTATVTDKLLLSAGSNALPDTKLTEYKNSLTSLNCTGYLSKISIYNPTANASVTINNNSNEGFLLEAGVALDLDRAAFTNDTAENDPTNCLATGTAGDTIYIVYSIFVLNN